MPPIIALIICTAFVLYLLWLERKQGPEVSILSWIPTIYMLYVASKPLAVWFGAGGDDSDVGSPLDRNFLFILLCVGLLILIKRRFNWPKALKENYEVLLLLGFMFISISWSDIPFTSIKRWSRELIAVIMAFLLLTESDPRQAMQSILRRTIYILIPFSYILIHYYPHLGRMYGRWSGAQMWVGVTMQKNGLGRLCFFAAFFIIWTLIRRWRGRDTFKVKGQTRAEILVLIITMYLFFGLGTAGSSASGQLTFFVGLIGLLGLMILDKFKVQIGVVPLMVVIIAVIIFGTYSLFERGSTLGSFSSVTNTYNRDETLTGRTEIWEVTLPIAMQRPFVGFGVGGFWTEEYRNTLKHSDPHSGYLGTLLDFGFVGLLVFSVFLLISCGKAQKVMTEDFDWGSLWFCILLMVVFHNMVETSLNTLANHSMGLILFLTVAIPKKT
ncbi:MAG: O-antigen ligase family protein [Thermodesulfobacteriota bacterium]